MKQTIMPVMTNKCQIENYVVTQADALGRGVNGPAIAQTRCITHNWHWQPGAYMTAVDEMMCPIGRIERVTDIAIAKIEAAMSKQSKGI